MRKGYAVKLALALVVTIVLTVLLTSTAFAVQQYEGAIRHVCTAADGKDIYRVKNPFNHRVHAKLASAVAAERFRLGARGSGHAHKRIKLRTARGSGPNVTLYFGHTFIDKDHVERRPC
jgi:hypothetical protein